MDHISKEIINNLIEIDEKPCISIYLPTIQKGKETEQNMIRFKNSYRKAGDILASSYGLSRLEIIDILEPAKKLIDNYPFWQHQSSGLTVLMTPDNFNTFRLPIKFKELVHIGDRFHLKPLLPLITEDNYFYILAISQNNIRILEGTRFNVSEVELDEAPPSLKEVLKDMDFEKELQFYTGLPKVQDQGGKQQAVFHGTGAKEMDKKKIILNYFHKLDREIHDMLKNQNAPLVLACVDFLFPIYKEANTYKNLYERNISGNPDSVSDVELHNNAVSILKPYFNESLKESIQRFKELSGKNSELCSIELEDILKASFQSRVDFIFVPFGLNKWGSFDLEKLEVKFHNDKKNGSEDLFDLAAIYSYLNGGKVYVLQKEKIPSESNIAATYRF